jgi:hypothetical protein
MGLKGPNRSAQAWVSGRRPRQHPERVRQMAGKARPIAQTRDDDSNARRQRCENGGPRHHHAVRRVSGLKGPNRSAQAQSRSDAGLGKRVADRASTLKGCNRRRAKRGHSRRRATTIEGPAITMQKTSCMSPSRRQACVTTYLNCSMRAISPWAATDNFAEPASSRAAMPRSGTSLNLIRLRKRLPQLAAGVSAY